MSTVCGSFCYFQNTALFRGAENPWSLHLRLTGYHGVPALPRVTSTPLSSAYLISVAFVFFVFLRTVLTQWARPLFWSMNFNRYSLWHGSQGIRCSYILLPHSQNAWQWLILFAGLSFCSMGLGHPTFSSLRSASSSRLVSNLSKSVSPQGRVLTFGIS